MGLGNAPSQLAPLAREVAPIGLGPGTIDPFSGPASPNLGGMQVRSPNPFTAETIDPFAGEPMVNGNVDLYAQPKVKNPDGSVSTVHSASYNLDGRETLLPSVTPDGRHLQSDDAIVGEYRRTGRHLGQFDTPQNADAYARRLHDQYERGMYDQRPSSSPISHRAPQTTDAQVHSYSVPYHPDIHGARAQNADLRRGPPMTPEQQGIVDAFWDEMDKWSSHDELGRRVISANRIDMGNLDRGTQRFVEDEERAARIQAVTPPPRKVDRREERARKADEDLFRRMFPDADRDRAIAAEIQRLNEQGVEQQIRFGRRRNTI